MKINGTATRYGRIEIPFDVNTCANRILIHRPDGRCDTVLPFSHQPIEITYDGEGIEHIQKSGDPILVCRYTPEIEGRHAVEVYAEDRLLESGSIDISGSAGHGYVEVATSDNRYFTYSDGTPYFWQGCNLCYPTKYPVSSGSEFAVTGNWAYIGLNQYRRWFKKCSENGINTVRIWLGDAYWCVDTDQAYELNPINLSKLDLLVDLAREFGLHLKLTLEHFRNFSYNSRALFDKRLYLGERRCESMREWLTDPCWSDAWMYKISELAKRFSGDAAVCMIELWNEMNCVGTYDDNPQIIEWNRIHLPRVKALFPRQLVANSLGSLDADIPARFYRDFCWEKSDVLQIHRYLDQGAPYAICGESPLPSIKEAFEYMRSCDRPMLLAETGGVNNCHSGPFKYYSVDDRGIIFVDCVYTPIFVGSAGFGNIWHWDDRYVESKNLYKYFKPLSDLLRDVDPTSEQFTVCDASNDEAYVYVLKGKSITLGFVRNRTDNWQNTLRNMGIADPISVIETGISANTVELYPIWHEDTSRAHIRDGKLVLENIFYGTLFKISY